MKKKLQPVDPKYLERGHVIKNGAISKFGTVEIEYHLLFTSLENLVEEDEKGTFECWSEALYEYRNKNVKVKVFNSGLEVYNRRGICVAKIPNTEIFKVWIADLKVSSGGWIMPWYYPKTLAKVLDYALENKKFPVRNLAEFVKVPTKYANSKLKALIFDPEHLDIFKLFTPEGRLVKQSLPFSKRKLSSKFLRFKPIA